VKHTESAGGVVLNKKGQVLVVNQNGDSWSLPKGHIDAGETALSAAKREIWEETGVKELSLIQSFGSYRRSKIGVRGGEDKTEMKTIHMFLFETSQEKLNPRDPRNPEACWVDKSKVADLLTHRKDREFFLGILKELK